MQKEQSTHTSAPDEAVRQTIRGTREISKPVASTEALRLDTNMIVSAGAGSGKTSLLIERLVVLIRSGVAVDEVVAITFTRKAAGELQERFFSRLLAVRTELAQRVAQDDREAEWKTELDRVEIALKKSEEAFVGTIHSFCSRILRLFPTAAGLPADFQQIEEADELILRKRFWQEAMAEANKRNDAHLGVLRDMEIPDSALFQLFSTCVDLEGVTQSPSGTGKPDVESAFDLLVEALKALQPLLPQLVNPDPFLLAIERCMLVIDGRSDWTDALRIQVMEQLVSTIKDKGEGPFDIKVRSWGKKAEPHGALAYALRDGNDETVDGNAFIDLIRNEIQPVLAQCQHWLHDHALQCVLPIVAGYRDHRVRSGKLTYDDLLREAGRVVRDSSAVRESLQTRFTRILVDEFQDTDPEQAALLFSLCASSLDPTDWRKNSLIPGRLFVVGDDKQSIYRFRKADFQAFHTVCEAIEAQQGLHLQLTANFRSDARICQWVNTTVGPLFEEDGPPYQAGWQDLEPFRGALHDQAPVQRLAIDKQQKGRSDMPRTVAEGKAIAALIQKADHESFGEWMILVRNHTRVPILMRMLTDAGIPVALEGGKGDRVADTIAVVHDLLSCLVNPSDQVALVATLTGVWFGVTDEDLMHYRQAGGAWEGWLEDIPALEGVPEALHRASGQLRSWSEYVHSSAPLVVFERILAESGIAGAMQRRMDGSVAVGMLELIGELIAGMQATGMHMTECVRELGRYRRGELDLELFSDNVPFRDSVRIMTVHGSKGLQAKRVVLADVSPNKDHDPQRHVWRNGPELKGLTPVRTKPGRFSSQLLEPAGWRDAVEQEKRYERAEEVRLLYVASTRAQEQLVVCTHAAEGKGTWDMLIPALESADVPTTSIVPELDDLVPGFALRDLPNDSVHSTWVDPSSRIQELSVSNWSVRRPSDHEAEEGLEGSTGRPHKQKEEGRGRRFGSAMHTLFEALAARRKDAPTHAELRALTARVFDSLPGMDNETRKAASSHLVRFMESELWQSLHAADRVLTEVPFTTRINQDGEEVLSSGIVDLAFLKGQEWTIVDYKTDRTDEITIFERHASQVNDYVQAWSTLFEGSRVRGIIWSTGLDRALEISSSDEQERGEA